MAQKLSDMWRSTFEIGAAQLRSVIVFAPPQLTALVWTEALSDMVFVAAHELSGIVWTASGAFNEPPVPLAGEAWARGSEGSGDIGFEVLDLRTSGHFQFKRKLENSPSKALNYLNLQSLTLRQEQVNAIRNVVENQKWPEVLKSRTSNPVFSEPPGPRANAPRRLGGRECRERRK